MGKGNSVFPYQTAKSKYDLAYKDLEPRFKIMWFSTDNNHYIALVQVPSQSLTNLCYDVILDFDGNKIPDQELTINNTEMKVFSNCPSFIYTYANVFFTKGYLCNWINSKYSSQVLQERPVNRNSSRIIFYEYSLYLAMKYIITKSYNRINRIKMLSKPIHRAKDIEVFVKSQDEKETEYKKKIQIKKDEEKKEKEKALQASKNLSNAQNRISPNHGTISKSKIVPKIKSNSKVKTISKSASLNKSHLTKKVSHIKKV
jgi:hypothetical protein